MSQSISADAAFARRMQNRGITEDVGVFGDHRVRLGKGSPIRLDRIQSAAVPWAGFTRASRIQSGFDGAIATTEDAVRTLIRPGGLDAKSLLGALKAQRTHLDRLGDLDILSQERKAGTAWLFAPAVEQLSNAELAALCQRFTTAEMDLLMAALQHETSLDPETDDAWNAARALFDLQAQALQETSIRAARGVAADERAAHPERRPEPAQPERLSEHKHDITAANLRTLVETASASAIQRENTADEQTARLENRSLNSVSLKEMGDVMRSAELTINIPTNILIGEGSVVAHPDDPLDNIFHLADKGSNHNGTGALKRRDETERLLFPELNGHDAKADERPVYGALNLAGRPGGAAAANQGHGSSVIVLKPEVARRATYTADATFLAPAISITPERRQAFYALLDDAKLPRALVTALRDANSPERAAMDGWFDALADVKSPRACLFKVPPSVVTNMIPEAERDNLQTLLIRCFGDKNATRKVTASWDNLESILPELGDIDGNALANAAMKSRDGFMPRAYLRGTNYVEAQIHGPLVPSRDIQEVRIDLGRVPKNDRSAVMTRMVEFQDSSGIPVTFLHDDGVKPPLEDEKILNDQKRFDRAHYDTAFQAGKKKAILDSLDAHLQTVLAARPDLRLPGALSLKGASRLALERAFDERAAQELRDNPMKEDLMEQAFRNAAERILREKLDLLRELEKPGLAFESDEQKRDFAAWICGDGDLRSPEELRFFHAQAKAHPDLFKELLARNPPLKPKAIARKMVARTQQDIIADLDAHLRKKIAGDEKLREGLPAALKGAFTLHGTAKEALEKAVKEEVSTMLGKYPKLEPRLAELAFDEAAGKILQQKADLLREMEKLDFESEDQKLGFADWICGVDLHSAEEVRLLHARAKDQAALFREMLKLAPPPTPTEIVRRMSGFVTGTDAAMDAGSPKMRAKKTVGGGIEYISEMYGHIADISFGMLRDGEPKLDANGLNALNALLNGPDQRQKIAMFTMSVGLLHPGEGLHAQDWLHMRNLHMQMCINAQCAARAAERPWTEPEFVVGLELIPKSAREIIRKVAPQHADDLDRDHPAHPPFPAPAMPDRLPQDDAGRRRFLVGVLDVYRQNEERFEKDTHNHGRGHIARAWIFATVMCNFLEEQGLRLDRNAVLCGIAGHDMGRQAGGKDNWETRSAEMTVKAMQETFGADSMGPNYAREVHDSINAHKSGTLEALVLNSADSLDIGRLGPGRFDMKQFPFLLSESKIGVFSNARKLREALAEEADLLQRLTNPLCQWQGFLDELDGDIAAASDANDDAAVEVLSRQKDALLKHIADEFAKERELTSEQFMARVEDVIRTHRDLFPTLSRHYPLAPAPNPEAPAEAA